MKREDWYRNTLWTEEIKKVFFGRLNRSRDSFNKAQYARIQAGYLYDTGKNKNILAAIELLDLVLKEWPERSELAATYVQRAKCLEYLDKFEEALQEYRNSVEAEKKYPGIKVCAPLELAWFVVRCRMTNKYDEALAAMELISKAELVWPINLFKHFSVLAILSEHYGDIEAAKRFAGDAFSAIGMNESPFRYHKKLGLVKKPDKKIVKTLKGILKKR